MPRCSDSEVAGGGTHRDISFSGHGTPRGSNHSGGHDVTHGSGGRRGHDPTSGAGHVGTRGMASDGDHIHAFSSAGGHGASSLDAISGSGGGGGGRNHLISGGTTTPMTSGHGMPRHSDSGGGAGHGGGAIDDSGGGGGPTWTAADFLDEIEIGELELDELRQRNESEKIREAEHRQQHLRAQLAEMTASTIRTAKIAETRARQQARKAQAANQQRRGPPPMQHRDPGSDVDPNRKRMADRAHDSAKHHAKKLHMAGQKSNGACQNLHGSGKAGDSIKAAQKKAQQAARQAVGPHPPPMREAKKNCSFCGTTAGCSMGAACGCGHSAAIETKNRSREQGKEPRAGGRDRHPGRMSQDFGGELFGVVSSWLEDKGHGFVKPDVRGSKGQVFFHRTGTVLQEAMPATTKVECANGKDKNGKSAAAQVHPLN